MSKHLPFGDRRDAPWYGQSIVSVRQFAPADLEYVFGVANEMREMVGRVGSFDLLKGKLLANLFYEPSTRTASSFTAAMLRLGGAVIPITEVRYSSVSKGESLPDTVRTLECYADVHRAAPPRSMGAAAEAAQVARKPIINAGDGVGEHPTQALLDLFTIALELGRYTPKTGLSLDGLTVTLLGDLKYGRTVHSLARLLSLFGVRLNLVSPELLRMPEKMTNELDRARWATSSTTSLEAVLPAERRALRHARAEGALRRPRALRVAQARVHHHARDDEAGEAEDGADAPVPARRRDSPEVDADPRAAYFRQMEYGLYVRMALLAMVLGKA